MTSNQISHLTRTALSCPCDRNKVEVQKLVALPGCTEDNAAVAALPDVWEPRRGGPILANYLKKRELDHQTVLQDLKKAASKLNDDIDAKIRTLAENLQSLIQQNQIDMNCVVEDCNYNSVGHLSAEARNDAIKIISKLCSQRVEEMAKFKREALALERERADGLRQVLRGHFQRLIAVGNQTPKDLLHDFDERSYEANQQLLSNSRAYAELVAQLRAQADESVIRAKSSINQLCLGVQLTYRSRSAQLSSISTVSSRQRSQSAADSHKKRSSSSASIKNILGGVIEFDECVALLVEAYRNAVRKVFTGFSGKLTDLREDLDRGGRQESEYVDDEPPEIGEMIERTLRRLSSCVGKMPSSKNLLELTLSDALSMKQSLISLGDHLRSTYTILHNAGHLWDAHIMRSALAQKLTMSAVEDLITSNDSIELANEIQFNVALEQLRCCADIEKLQQLYDALIVLLDKTAELYLHHSEAEIGRIEEFMNLPATMANILLAEFDCFLERHPRAHAQPPPDSPEPVGSVTPTARRYLSLSTSPLPRIILQSELQGLALQNWKNGFLESFESNVHLVPDELTRQARSWADEKNSGINIRYSMKMMSHSIRAERVKAARETRYLELRNHEARLNSHLEAIRELVESMPVEASEFQSLDSPAFYPFCSWIDRLQASMDEILARDPIDPEIKRLHMSSYAPRLIKHRNLFEISVDEVIAGYKKSIEQRIQAARVSNVRFASVIKLFGEGGTYAALEAMKTSAALVRAADSLEACVNKTFDCLSNRRSQLLALADQRIAPLLRASEEFSKGVKGGAKKQPPPAAKKKM